MKKKILILLMLFMFIPGVILADSVSISCTKTTLTPGGTSECTIKGSTSLTSADDNYIAGVTGRVSVLGDLEIVSVTKDSAWDNGTSEEKIDFYTNKGFNGSFNIAKVKVKVKSTYTSGNLRLVFQFNDSGDVEFYDKFGSTRKAGTANVKFNVASSIDTLSDLSVDGYELNPTFDPSVLSYNLGNTDAASIKISAIATDGDATISGTGTKNLAYGENTFSIVCKSEKGTTKTYKIKITRNDNREDNNNLKSLTVSDYEIDPLFSSNVTKYTLEVTSDVNKINVDAITDSVKATFVKNYGPRDISLNYGKNEILIKVKSEKGNTKTYTLIVNREDDREDNNYLKNLTIEGYEITFNKSTNKYEINVLDDVNSLKITAEAESLKASVTISGNAKFKSGNNTVTISVKAENESVRKYVINVIKGTKVEEETPENNEEAASIYNVTIDGKDFGFDELVNDYDIKLDQNTDELDLKYELSEGVTGFVDGNEKLKNGSVVTLTVNGISDKIIYTFNIIKDSIAPIEVKTDKNGKSNLLLYGIIGGSIIVIGLILFFILKKKNKKKEEVNVTTAVDVETHVANVEVTPPPVVEPEEAATPAPEEAATPVVAEPTPVVVEPTPVVVEPTPVTPTVPVEDALLNPVEVVPSVEQTIANPLLEPQNATPVVNGSNNDLGDGFQKMNF